MRCARLQAHHLAHPLRALHHRSPASQDRRPGARVRLKILPPRVGTLDTRVQAAPQHQGTPRQRGRGLMERRQRWFSLHPLCAQCEKHGRVRAAVIFDHIKPLSEGGPDDDTNVQGLCITCHDDKTAREARSR